MKKLELLEWTATHTVGYLWIRKLYIGKTKAGTFSVTATDENFDGPSQKVPGRFGLHTASQILHAIIELAVELNPDADGDIERILNESDLKRATAVIRELDPAMAEAIESEIDQLPEDLWDVLE